MATITQKVQSINDGIATVKANFKTALENKGITVQDGLKLKEYPPLVAKVEGASYYKCISVNTNNKTWQGVKATIDDSGDYVFEDEAVTLTYDVRPEVGYVYDQSGKIYVAELNRNLGFDVYRRRQSGSDMGGYNLDLLDEVDNTSYSNAGYYFHRVKNIKFRDYVVPGEYGSYALAIGVDGNLYSWGGYSWGDCISGIGGALSNPNPNKSTYQPRLADASGNWATIYATYQNTWVRNFGGELYRCGDNSNGQLGFGDSRKYWKLTKLEVDGVTSWKMAAVCDNANYTLVLSIDGRLFVSGYGSYGELGLGSDNTQVYSFTEIIVDGVEAWDYVFCGRYNAGAISNAGELYVWGRNHYGQLAQGEGNSDNQYRPIKIGADKTWIRAAFGDNRILAIADDGSLWGCGLANDGRLGLGSFYGTKYELTRIGNRTDWDYVICNNHCNLVRNSEGKLYYCGYGSAAYGGGSSGNETVLTYHGYKVVTPGGRLDFRRILTDTWNDDDVTLLNFYRSSSTLTVPDGANYLTGQPFQDSGYGTYSTVYIPATVDKIAANAFSGLYSTNIVFEAEQSAIPEGYPWGHQGGDSYFSYGATFEHAPYNEGLINILADSVPTLVIPEGATSLNYKFKGYQSIRTAIIPDGVTSMEYTFYNCPNLEKVYLGDLDDSGYFYMAFSGCPITTIYCSWERGTKPNIENQAPWGASGATVLYAGEEEEE